MVDIAVQQWLIVGIECGETMNRAEHGALGSVSSFSFRLLARRGFLSSGKLNLNISRRLEAIECDAIVNSLICQNVLNTG